LHTRYLLLICVGFFIVCYAGSAKDPQARDPKKDLLKKWSGMGDSPLLNPQTENPIRLGALIEIRKEGSDVLPFLPDSSDYNWIDKKAVFAETTEPPDMVDKVTKIAFHSEATPFAKEISKNSIKALAQAQTQLHLKPGVMRIKMLALDNMLTECQKTQESQLTKDYCKHVLGGGLYLVYALRIVDSMDYSLDRNKSGAISFQAGIDAPECPKPSSPGHETPGGGKSVSAQQQAASSISAGFSVCVRDEYTLSVTTPHVFSVRVAHFDKKGGKMDGRKQYTITLP